MLRLLPAVAVAIACAPLLWHGYPKGSDWSLELVRLAEFRAALAAPPWPPAWAGNVYGGFGAPVFVYYPPLFSLLACALGTLLGSLWNGAVAALCGLLALGAFGAQRLVRELAPHDDGAAARVAASSFALSPYLLCDALLRNANAELTGLAVAPLALLGVARLPARPRAGVVLLALGLGLCVLAHNLTALVVAAALVGALALDARNGRPGAGVLGVALGLALAAFFWVPALVYQPLMRSGELLSGKFDFHRSFASLAEAFGYARFYAAGGLAPLLLAAGALAAARGPAGHARRWLLGCIAAGALCALLVTRASTPLWEHLPLLPLFQFPWRFLGPIALFAALAGGLGFARLAAGRTRRVRTTAELALFALCVANALPMLLRAQPLDSASADHLARRLAPGTIRSRGLRITARDEYLPAGADASIWRDARFVAAPVLAIRPDAEIRVRRNRPTQIRLDVVADRPVELHLGRWSYPGWRLRIDGAPAPLARGDAGTLALALPAGRHAVAVDFRGPPLRRALVPLSAAALLLWIVLAIRARAAGGRSR